MTDYKHTLNLPQTQFPMKADLAKREPLILEQWIKRRLYQQIRQHCKTKPVFLLQDGPPYANARPHLGTALNKILKDITVKMKTLQGLDAPFIPGWDCHGLPIELNVEKKLGKVGDKLSPKAFRAACRQYATSQVALQKTDFQRLGILADWDHPYLTMDFSFEANTIRALAKIIENGHLQRGQKPVHWCIDCGSALAEAEVEYREKSSPAIDVAFVAVDPAAILACFALHNTQDRVIVPIWTTTPWTLPANQAVCLHPELHYALVKCVLHEKTTYLVLAKDLVDSTLQRYGINDYEVHGNVLGQVLQGQKLQHPFLERVVPIILGEHVTTEAGTGNVHTAPAHGLDDYRVGLQYALPLDNPVDSRGCFIAETPLVARLFVFKANESLMVTLADNGHLLHHDNIQHSYPHCWRHKKPLIFRATPQWFISLDKNGLRDMALSAIDAVKWLPQWGQNRIALMVANRPDWCISRQRQWGIPIALFIHKNTGALHPDTLKLMEQVAQLIEKNGIDAWFDLEAAALLGNTAADYEKVTDTLDVWFESGVVHFCVANLREHWTQPADLYLEGSDQHSGWFQSSLLAALAISSEAPYKTVLTHGYVVDVESKKMSKSGTNAIAPEIVVRELGADVLRLWVAASDHTDDISASQEILKRSSEAYRRIRNTARFLLSNLNDFDPRSDLVPIDALVELDRWAIGLTQSLQEKIIGAYNDYHYQTVYQLIHNFCTVEMGSFYLDVIKDRQYTAKKDSVARRSAQTALFYIAEALVRWIAPILSFTAEEIWQYLPAARTSSVFLSTWYDQFPNAFLDAEQDYWQWMRTVRDEVNKVLEAHRNAGEIGSALDAEVWLYADNSLYEKLARLGEELRFALITSAAKVMPVNADLAITESNIPGLFIQVKVSQNAKCARCWQRREDVGNNQTHAALCGRCVENVVGAGESRQFA